MKEYLHHKLEGHDETVKKLRWLCLGLMPYLVFILLIRQMIDLKESRKEIGVMYDCGMKPSEFIRIIFYQNILKILPSGMIAIVLSWIEIYRSDHYSSAIRFDESIDYIIAGHVTVSTLILMVGMIVMILIVPVFWVYSHEPKEFMKETKCIGMMGAEGSVFASMVWAIPILMTGQERCSDSDALFRYVIIILTIFVISNFLYLTGIRIKEKNTEVKLRRDLGQSKKECMIDLGVEYLFLVLPSGLIGGLIGLFLLL